MFAKKNGGLIILFLKPKKKVIYLGRFEGKDMEAINILDVCSFFVGKGIEVGRPITQIKLQKLLYFSQGVHTVLYEGKALFPDKLFAWKYGPVAQDIYHIFKIFGNNPITENSLEVFYGGGADYFLSKRSQIPQVKIPFLESVWTVFGKYNSFELVELTHLPDSPWYSIYQRYHGNIPINVEIPIAQMREYFSRTITVTSPCK